MAGDSRLQLLIERRDRARDQLASPGDLRPGSPVENQRKCGKPNCHCARERAEGHGPSHVPARSVKGRTRSVRTEPEDLDEVRRQPGE